MGNQTMSKDWADAVEGFAVALRALGRSDETIRLRRVQIRQLSLGMGDVGPWEVTAATLLAWQGGKRWSAETRRSYRDALRGFYEWAADVGHVQASPASGLRGVPKPPPRPKPATDADYRAALARADERERLALRLGAEVGLRRSEIARIHLTDLLPDLLDWSLLVHGKGSRERVVPLPEALATDLRAACEAGGGWAFPGPSGHLSAHYLGQRLSALLPDGVSAHCLRHRFATRAYAHARDLLEVQMLLGHASVETTRRYVQLPKDGLRRTVEAIAA